MGSLKTCKYIEIGFLLYLKLIWVSLLQNKGRITCLKAILILLMISGGYSKHNFLICFLLKSEDKPLEDKMMKEMCMKTVVWQSHIL